MVNTFTRHYTLVVEDCPETAGEILEMVQHRVSFSPHGVGPLRGFTERHETRVDTLSRTEGAGWTVAR
jgi:hypothetical protein